MILDIDECSEDSSICDHTCVNEPGSYTCACDDGYTLAADRSTCSGLFTSKSYFKIQLLHFEHAHKEIFKLLIYNF